MHILYLHIYFVYVFYIHIYIIYNAYICIIYIYAERGKTLLGKKKKKRLGEN